MNNPIFKLKKVIVLFKDHDSIVYEDMKDKKMVLKEGCEYKIQYFFNVNSDLVKGLTNITSYFKAGFCVSKDNVEFGDFKAQNETYEVSVPPEGWMTAPSGFIARGSYNAKIQFISDDEKVNLEVPYQVEIKKDWN